MWRGRRPYGGQRGGRRCVTGKWMLFPSLEEADMIWATIARETAEGCLGCSAKIGPTKGTDKP